VENRRPQSPIGETTSGESLCWVTVENRMGQPEFSWLFRRSVNLKKPCLGLWMVPWKEQEGLVQASVLELLSASTPLEQFLASLSSWALLFS